MRQIDGLNAKNVINGEKQKKEWVKNNILDVKMLIKYVIRNKKYQKTI